MTSNQKNKLWSWLPGRKYVKLFSRRKTCPLTFNERLVFSLLVYASRRKSDKGLSQRGIARILQIDKDTVPKVVESLIRHDLAERRGVALFTKQPAQEMINWFVYLNHPGCARWQDQYAYLLVALPEPCKSDESRKRLKLSPHQIAVYCLLVNKEQGGRVAISRASIAGLLGIDVRTVGSALARLEEFGLVETLPRANAVHVNRPHQSQLCWFQARKEPVKKVALYEPDQDKPWESMTPAEIDEWVSDPAVNEITRLYRRIRYCGRYTQTEMDAIRKKANAISWAHSGILTRLFNEAEREHHQTQKRGMFLGRNSFPLLNYKLDEWLRTRGASPGLP